MFTENSISIYTLFYTDDGFHVTEGVTLVYMDGVFEGCNELLNDKEFVVSMKKHLENTHGEK